MVIFAPTTNQCPGAKFRVMAVTKSKTKAKKLPQKSQAERFLEAARKAGVKENSFQRAMGKLTLQRNARKKVG